MNLKAPSILDLETSEYHIPDENLLPLSNLDNLEPAELRVNLKGVPIGKLNFSPVSPEILKEHKKLQSTEFYTEQLKYIEGKKPLPDDPIERRFVIFMLFEKTDPKLIYPEPNMKYEDIFKEGDPYFKVALFKNNDGKFYLRYIHESSLNSHLAKKDKVFFESNKGSIVCFFPPRDGDI